MNSLNLTVKVLDLSPKVTLADLNSFFSYCGTISAINLQSYKDQTQMAYVTFKTPCAYQTCLLLNGVTIGGNPIRILPLDETEIPIMSHETNNEMIQKKQGKNQGTFNPNAALNFVIERLKKRKVELEQNYEIASERGKELMLQLKYIVWIAEHIAGNVAVATINSEPVASGALWLSGVLDKASKRVSKFGNKNRSVSYPATY